MTPQQLIGLALRLAALWMIPTTFQLYALAVATATQSFADASSVWYFIALLPALLCIPLWLFPMAFAHRLLPQPKGRPGRATTLAETGSAIAVIVGVWAFIQALPHLYAGFAIRFMFEDMGPDNPMLVYARGDWFYAAVIQYALGLCLICMPRFLCNLVFPRQCAITAGELA